MASEKRGKQRAASQEIESSPSFDSEAAPEDSPIGPHARKMKAVQKVPLCSCGHGRIILQGISSQGSCPCMKHASTPGAHMDDAGESL
jgi:hypothetical protein